MFSFDNIEWMVNDYQRRQRGIVWLDGRQDWQPLGDDEPGVDNIARSIFSPERWWMFHHTTAGDIVITETYSPIPEDPLKGRPVIYLDQMHWRTMADITRGRAGDVRRSSEVAPAVDLLTRATDGQVILPMSGGTLSETTALYQANRYHAGIAVAQLAAGWQMHHSVRVREEEIYHGIARQLAIEVEPMERVVTLKPRAVFSDGVETSDHTLAYLIKCMTWSGTMVHMLIDPESIDRNAEKAEQWVAAMQKNTNTFQEQTEMDPRQKKEIAHGLVWHDLRQHIDRAAERLEVGHIPTGAIDFNRLRRDCSSVQIYAHG
jgi:hypothetical protein